MADEKPKKTKISQMTLDQVIKAIGDAKKSMGGTYSLYAQALRARQDQLQAEHSPSQK